MHSIMCYMLNNDNHDPYPLLTLEVIFFISKTWSNLYTRTSNQFKEPSNSGP